MATLVVAQSPRYFPHVERHLNGLKKAFPSVRLLYWEKDPSNRFMPRPGSYASAWSCPSETAVRFSSSA